MASDPNAPAIAFRRNSASAVHVNGVRRNTHSLRVRLKGRAGNPTAVGACVTATFENGQTVSSEVTAGAGYYSQSSAALFFGFTTEKNPVRRLTIRWPNGATCTQEVKDASSKLEIVQP